MSIENSSTVYERWLVVKEIRDRPTSLPVPVEEMAQALGVGISYESFQGDEELISGLIKKDGENKYIIVVNKSHPEVRQRFTIAHEIAHFVLHKDKIGDGIIDHIMYRGSLSNQDEVAANQMAADILMPYDKIITVIKDMKEEIEVSALARKFNVSALAMAIRLDKDEKYYQDYHDENWLNDLRQPK
ncbi:MAG: ImmA/IrrE family metallo-endopeptidase [Hydrotalea sp.]|nr:ImmA/IrrE family metallo-endopeptidase [Hydrotalea sp.]